MHSCLHKIKFLHRHLYPAKTTMTRHKYYTRDNKSKIMVDIEHENFVVKETLAQFQGKMDLFQCNMDVIMEYLQAQKATTSANPTSIDVVTNVIIVTTTFIDALLLLRPQLRLWFN